MKKIVMSRKKARIINYVGSLIFLASIVFAYNVIKDINKPNVTSDATKTVSTNTTTKANNVEPNSSKDVSNTTSTTSTTSTSSDNSSQSGISSMGLEFTMTKYQILQNGGYPWFRTQFKLKNISNSSIYLDDKSFCLRQNGGNSIDANTDGGGYSYGNDNIVVYETNPISLKSGDTCDVSFDFNLNKDNPNVFDLYYNKSGKLVLITNLK